MNFRKIAEYMEIKYNTKSVPESNLPLSPPN